MAYRDARRRPQKKKRWADRKERDEHRDGRVNAVCPGGGTSPVGKTSYRSYSVAEKALLRIRAEPDVPGEKKPVRVYQCDVCFLFHLTSMEQWDPPEEREPEREPEREAG